VKLLYLCMPVSSLVRRVHSSSHTPPPCAVAHARKHMGLASVLNFRPSPRQNHTLRAPRQRQPAHRLLKRAVRQPAHRHPRSVSFVLHAPNAPPADTKDSPALISEGPAARSTREQNVYFIVRSPAELHQRIPEYFKLVDSPIWWLSDTHTHTHSHTHTHTSLSGLQLPINAQFHPLKEGLRVTLSLGRRCGRARAKGNLHALDERLKH